MSIYKSLLRHYVGADRATHLLARADRRFAKNQPPNRRQLQTNRLNAASPERIPTKQDVIRAVVKAEVANPSAIPSDAFDFIGQFYGGNPDPNEIRLIGTQETYPPPRLLIDVELSTIAAGKPIGFRCLFDTGCDLPLVLSPAMCKQLGSVTVVDQTTVVTADNEASDHKVALVVVTVAEYRFLTEACIMETDEPYIGNFILKYFDVIFKDDQFVLMPRVDKIGELELVKQESV